MIKERGDAKLYPVLFQPFVLSFLAWDMVSKTTPRISKEVISTTPMAVSVSGFLSTIKA